MEKKTIRIDFVDVWDNFDKENNFIMEEIKNQYNVVIDAICPEYIFFSAFGNSYLTYEGVRIFFTGEARIPEFNFCDYAMGFDYLQFGDRYIRIPTYMRMGKQIFSEIEERLSFGIEELKEKEGFCNFVYSNGGASNERNSIFDKLNEYRRVDSGGRYRNNIGGPVSDKQNFLKKYKFTIAFENSRYPGYTTEKIVDAFRAKTIPIYWGNPLVDLDFNKEAFISCSGYEDLDEVVNRVKYLDQNNAEYLKIMHKQVFAEQTLVEETRKKLREFLFNIFEQDYNCAFRRNRTCYGCSYEKQVRDLYDRYSQADRKTHLGYKIKRTLKGVFNVKGYY